MSAPLFPAPLWGRSGGLTALPAARSLEQLEALYSLLDDDGSGSLTVHEMIVRSPAPSPLPPPPRERHDPNRFRESRPTY